MAIEKLLKFPPFLFLPIWPDSFSLGFKYKIRKDIIFVVFPLQNRLIGKLSILDLNFQMRRSNESSIINNNLSALDLVDHVYMLVIIFKLNEKNTSYTRKRIEDIVNNYDSNCFFL